MPESEAVTFDAFHHHCWRRRWDSRVSQTEVVGGAPCPFVGAVTVNAGAGALRGLSMRTPKRSRCGSAGVSSPPFTHRHELGAAFCT